MADYRLTPRAQQDLRDIWNHIAPDNPTAADALFLRLFEKFALAADYPEIGVARPELSQTARLLIEGHYIVIYEAHDDGVLIVAIIHGMRDPMHWLD